MKRSVIILLLANIVFWWYIVQLPSDDALVAPVGNQGLLPRVSQIEIAVDELPADEVSVPGAAQGERYCFRLGWFKNEVAAKSAANALGLTATEFKITDLQKQLEPFNWVIIPPLPTRAEAQALVERLQQENIDSYLVTGGEQANGISLGLFVSREIAREFQLKLRERDLNAELALFPRSQLSYALEFLARPGITKAEIGLLKQDYARRFDLVEISVCQGVASPKKNP